MTIKEVAAGLREGSAIAKMFNEIKDGKPHNLQIIRAKFIKGGVKKPIQLAWRLCRILRANKTGYMVELSKRDWSIQLVPFRPFGAKPAATKVVAKKVVKPVAKKVVAKPAAKKVVKPSTIKTASAHNDKPRPAAKPEPVLVGMEEE